VTGPLVFAIDELGVAKSDILHDAGEGNVAHLNSQMGVRRHETEGMDAIPETFDAFLEQQEKPRAVTRIEEDVLAAIAAKNDMINGAGEMKSWIAWHGSSIDMNLRLSSLTPNTCKHVYLFDSVLLHNWGRTGGDRVPRLVMV